MVSSSDSDSDTASLAPAIWTIARRSAVDADVAFDVDVIAARAASAAMVLETALELAASATRAVTRAVV